MARNCLPSPHATGITSFSGVAATSFFAPSPTPQWMTFWNCRDSLKDCHKPTRGNKPRSPLVMALKPVRGLNGNFRFSLAPRRTEMFGVWRSRYAVHALGRNPAGERCRTGRGESYSGGRRHALVRADQRLAYRLQ